MLKEFSLNLLNYTSWANGKLFSIVPEELADLQLKSSFSTIRKTFMHIWDAEIIWFQRMSGNFSNVWPPEKNAIGNMPADLKELLTFESEFISLILNKDESFFTERMTYTNLQGHQFSNEYAHTIQHVVNHSTFHRGQVVTMLRELGVTEIPATDLIAYYREKGI